MSGRGLRRKLAIATWRAPSEPNILGRLEVDATAALAYVEEARERTGAPITLTSVVGRALAAAMAAEPSLNGTIRFGRFVPHDDVAITFLVSMEDGSDLAKVKVDRAHRRSVAEVAEAVAAGARRLRDGADQDWERSKQLVRWLPPFLLRPVVWLVGWLTGALGVEAREAGLEPYPFGSAIVTSVGMFGLDEAYVPPTPFARVPLYVLIGAVREVPAVVDGEVVVRPRLTLTATLDHRLVDGFQAGVLAREFRRALEDPWSLDGDRVLRPRSARGAGVVPS